MEVIKDIWAAVPGSLKRFVGFGLASGIALALVLAMYLFWGTGYLQERLGLMVTKEDLKEQTDQLADGSADMVRTVAEAVAAEKDEQLRAYLEQERQLAKDTILVPIIKSIRDLDANVRALARSQAQISGRVNELPTVLDGKMLELLNAMPPAVTPDQINDLTDLVREQQQQIEDLREEIQRGRRTTRKQF